MVELRNVRCTEWCKKQLIILKTNQVISGSLPLVEFILIRSTVLNKESLDRLRRSLSLVMKQNKMKGR